MHFRPSSILVPLLALLLSGCGFHLRKEMTLPAAMQQVHVESTSGGPLARDLASALARSGASISDRAGPGIAVLAISANRVSTDVLSVSGAARANEYSLRHHVEFSLRDGEGRSVIPLQTIELSREFTFDATQALGVSAEIDLLTKELERDMVDAVLRRLEIMGEAEQAAPVDSVRQ